MRIPTIEERTKYTYKLCKCGREYNVSVYHTGPYECPVCEAKKNKRKEAKEK